MAKLATGKEEGKCTKFDGFFRQNCQIDEVYDCARILWEKDKNQKLLENYKNVKIIQKFQKNPKFNKNQKKVSKK